VALWRHFPVDDQTPEGLAEATINFQQAYDFDLVKVTPASSFCLKDWGVEDTWKGATEGTREYTNRRIIEPEDWGKLELLDPFRGRLSEQLTCLELVNNQLGKDVPVLQTIFNPLSQAKNLAGGSNLIVHLRKYPAAVHEGLQVITEVTLRFIEAAKRTGIAGIFFALQHANYGLLNEQEYREFGCTYDLVILEAVRDLWLNMLHLHGDEVMFDLVAGYPVQVINWHDRDTQPSLADAKNRFDGVACGGLQREDTMVLGSPARVTAEATDAILSTAGERFILGTGCVLPTIAPRANIIAARQSVELSK
jgi:uroporphyrinogen decarboxylase